MKEINTTKQYIGLSPFVCKMNMVQYVTVKGISCSEVRLQLEVANSLCAYYCNH